VLKSGFGNRSDWDRVVFLIYSLYMSSFDHKVIEDKWRKHWREKGTYRVDLKKDKKPFYNLMMFPYPSAEGLHVGNMYAFTGADIYGRYKAMQGYDVFEPIGLDGFGIHSENYAIKIGKHPKEQAEISKKRFYEQLSRIGNRFSWDNRLETFDPEYYKWTQWIFVKMFENGLAYRKKSLVNWCPSCKTVLSDEQVEAGLCERCRTETTKKETYQWFFKITEYAQRLLDNLEKIDWPEKIKTAQRNWIGRKEGINITYKVLSSERKRGSELSSSDLTVTCFTTRPDTNFGATFVVLGPEHQLVKKMISGKIKVKDKVAVEKYVKSALKKKEIDRIAEGRKKTGAETGLVAINELTKKEMPIYITDFVLGHVGTGAVVGVPGHDKRDFEFAQEFGLEVIRVVVAQDGIKGEITKIEQVQEDEGVMINSGFLDGMDIHKATEKMMDYMEEKDQGKRVVSYRLRDWCISRQRYWGPPIPMMDCSKCGWLPEKLENLPVELPEVKDYEPTGDGKSPLEKAPESWLKVKCPKCGGKAKRETDVSDNFFDSAWYYLRYPMIGQNIPSRDGMKEPFDKEITGKWQPVDAYIGGAEHAVLHLMYSRFVTMTLKDWKYLDFDEPFPFLFGHGLIIKDGKKMSKSQGNTVNPDEYMDKYGTDALRMYLMFVGPYEQGGDFRDTGMIGMKKFLDRVWRLFEEKMGDKTTDKLKIKLEQTVKKVGEDFGTFGYNTAIAALMELVNVWKEPKEKLSKIDGQRLVKLIAPLAPYVSEEWWEKFGGKESVHNQPWPEYDKDLVEAKKVVVIVQVNGKLRGRLEVLRSESEDKEKMLKMAYEIETVKRFLDGKKVVKEIFVKGKLVNLVVR